MFNRSLVLTLASVAVLATAAPASAHIAGINVSHGAVSGPNLILSGRSWQGPNVPARPGGGGHGPNVQRKR
jgi:hypothetical protein